MGFPCGSAGKNPLVTQETWVRSLGWEDPPGKGKTTHSSVLAWRIPWTKELDTTEGLSLHFTSSTHLWAPLVAQLVKNPPAIQETSVEFLGQEDPLEEG